MKNKNKKNSVIHPVNKDLINMIQPSGVDFTNTGVLLSENYGKIMIINKFNTYPDYGWLAKINSMEGCIVKNHCGHADNGILIEQCNRQIHVLEQERNDARDESVRQDKTDAIETTKKLIRKIRGTNGENVVDLTVLVLVQAYSEELLEERVKDVKNVIAEQCHAIRNLTNYQPEGLTSISPYGVVHCDIKDIGEWSMPISTFWGGFPNATNGINDGRGWYMGKTPLDKIVMIDIWKRGFDRINSNWIITGKPGVGKSTTVKSLSFSEWAQGAKEIIFDPNKEYHDCVKGKDGKILDCCGGYYKINPLQVRTLPEDDEEESGEKLIMDAGHGTGQLAIHFQFLRSFFKMYKTEMTDLEMSTLEIALERCYTKKGITWDTDCTNLKPEEYPILEEVYKELQEMETELPEDKEIKSLLKRLYSICIGADSYIWNGYTNLDLDADSIDIDISRFENADKGIRGAQYYNLLTLIMQKVMEDPSQKYIVYVDEAYLLFEPDLPLPMLCLRNYAKQFRKFEGSLVIITHAVADLLEPAVKRFGQAIIDCACYKFIMGTDGQNFAETRALFKLTQEEEDTITSMQRGLGVLIAGASKVITNVIVKKEILEMMGTAGGR